jgi:hypothetical protein
MVNNDHWVSPQSQVTTPNDSTPLGWAKVTHPFHPRQGQSYQILKTRRVSGVETLILRDNPAGTFAIAKDWTNLSDPSSQADSDFIPLILHFDSLQGIVDIIKEIDKRGVEK